MRRQRHQQLRKLLNDLGYPYADTAVEGIRSGRYPIFLNYPVNPTPRYGYGRPPHPKLYEIINRERDIFRRHLEAILAFKERLLSISVEASDESPDPHWSSGWLSGLDAASLYSLVSVTDPRTYLEIGSGMSTKFAARAVRDHDLRTKIISLDPQPRQSIDPLKRGPRDPKKGTAGAADGYSWFRQREHGAGMHLRVEQADGTSTERLPTADALLSQYIPDRSFGGHVSGALDGAAQAVRSRPRMKGMGRTGLR